MPEAYHIFGQDLVLGANGDLLLVDGVDETRQRVLRRLLTNQGAYIWDLPYGAGLPAMVGQKAIAARIASIVRSQIFQETAVAKTPAPQITVSVNAGGTVICNVVYTDAIVGQSVALTFPIQATYSS